MKTEDILKKKKKVLDDFLNEIKQANAIIPVVQEAKEDTELSLRALQSAPPTISPVFEESSINNPLALDLSIWEKALPGLNIQPQFVTTSGSGASGTASAVVFNQVTGFVDQTQPKAVFDWASEIQADFISQRQKRDHIDEIANKLAKIYSGRETELLEANNLYHQAEAKTVPQKTAAIAMRNTLEHFQGDLYGLATKNSSNQVKKSLRWNLIADQLASFGIGSQEHGLLMNKKSEYDDVFGLLTKVAKNLSQNPSTDLTVSYTKWVNFLHSTLNLIDQKYF